MRAFACRQHRHWFCKPLRIVPILLLVVSASFLFFSRNASSKVESSANNHFQRPIKRSLTTSPHAYAFLIAGCNPTEPSYMGSVYGILVAANLLKDLGSTSDFVVMIRMATATTAQSLPQEVEALFDKAGVRIRYIPKVETDNFYTAIMEKFRILELVEYERVLFLDTDVMPVCNLDYVFHLSQGSDAVLRENLMVPTRGSPADAGFFMLKPDLADFVSIQHIIESREAENGGEFDVVKGWGHEIVPPDEWVAERKSGTKWNYYGAVADQGLMYHWAKYVKKSLSLVHDDTVETWGMDEANGNVKLLKSEQGLLEDVCSFRHDVRDAPRWTKGSHSPKKDYVHFVGDLKPWVKGEIVPKSRKTYKLWFFTLNNLLEKYNYEVDWSKLQMMPSLGLTVQKEQVSEKMKDSTW